ncbi:MAG TPA: YceI family protein [Rhodoblastus sp.]|nr:YceI family protein [Rhodoblastus sp.]
MKHVAFAAALAAFAPGPAGAAQWKILPGGALTFSGVQAGDKFSGRFSRFDGAISFDPDKLDEAKITIVVDMASAATGDRQRDAALPGSDWFDVAHFPQARFDSRKVVRAGAGYEAVGDLTLRGATREIRLPFTLTIDGAKAQAKGHVGLRREMFGIGQGDWASGEWIDLDVGVDFDIKAERTD